MSEAGRVAHDGHDLELVARAAAGDLDAREVGPARDLVATCGACAGLNADLRAITTATRELAPAVTRVASLAAPRDFRLTPADAARLRRLGFRDRVAASTRAAGLARGFGGALATLGLVGLLVSAGWPAFSGGSAGALVREVSASAGVGDSASPIRAVAPAPTALQALAASGEPPATGGLPGGRTSSTVTPWQAGSIASIGVLAAGLTLLLLARTRRGNRP